MDTLKAVVSTLGFFRSKEESIHRGAKFRRQGSFFWGPNHEPQGSGSEDPSLRRSSSFRGSHHGAMHYLNNHNTEGRRWWIIYPNNLWYIRWRMIHIVLAAYSGFYAPYDFAFLEKRPVAVHIWDWFLGFLFVGDVVLHFFVAYEEKKTYLMIDDPKKIAVRYLTSWFLLDLFAAIPYDVFVGGDTNMEVFRWLALTSLGRLRHFNDFFSTLERDVTVSYVAVRMIRLLVVVLFTAHLSACMFYYLAIMIHTADQDSTWIGLIYTSPPGFRSKSNMERYVISLYWSVVTLATVGYGDFHAVTVREMVWCIIYMLFNMVLMTYVLGSMTALIVSASTHTQDFRNEIRALKAFAKRNALRKDLRRQMSEHTHLKFETTNLRQDVIDHYPKSIRAKVTRFLYHELIKCVYLFEGCSNDFLDQIANSVITEWYLPEEEIIHKFDAADNFYILAGGNVELVETDHDGQTKSLYSLDKGKVFGEIGVLCNVAQPYTARTTELVKVLRVDRMVFQNIVGSYNHDGRHIVQNLLKRAKDENDLMGQKMANDITALIQQQEIEHTMNLCYIASRGDMTHLQKLVKGGLSPNRADYDGRSPLHLCSSKGYSECVQFLIDSGADVNCKDNFGVTPLMEALKGNHLKTANLIFGKGGRVNLAEAGSEMCNAAIHGNIEMLKHYIDFGVEADACDYDNRTALHVASAEGFLLVVKTLLQKGADPLFPDRWGHTAIDEAERWEHPQIYAELQQAVSRRGSEEMLRRANIPVLSPPSSRPTSPLRSPTELKASRSPTEINPPDTPTGAWSEHEKEQMVMKPGIPVLSPPSSRPTSPLRSPKEIKASAGRTSDTGGASGGSSRGYYGKKRASPLPSPTLLHPASPFGADRASLEGKKNVDSGSVLGQMATGSRIPYGDKFFHLLGSTTSLPASPRRKRVTINRYHPRSREALTNPGRVIALPSTMQGLLHLAAGEFDYDPTRVLSARGALMSELSLIEDGDILYIVEEKDFKGPSLPGLTSSQEHEIKDLIAKLQGVLQAVGSQETDTQPKK